MFYNCCTTTEIKESQKDGSTKNKLNFLYRQSNRTLHFFLLIADHSESAW